MWDLRKEIECAMKEVEGLKDVGVYLFNTTSGYGGIQNWIGVQAFVESQDRVLTKEMQVDPWYSAHATMRVFVKYFQEQAGFGELDPAVKIIRRCLLALEPVVDFTITVRRDVINSYQILRASVLLSGGRWVQREAEIRGTCAAQNASDYVKNIGRSFAKEFFDVIVLEGGDA